MFGILHARSIVRSGSGITEVPVYGVQGISGSQVDRVEMGRSAKAGGIIAEGEVVSRFHENTVDDRILASKIISYDQIYRMIHIPLQECIGRIRNS